MRGAIKGRFSRPPKRVEQKGESKCKKIRSKLPNTDTGKNEPVTRNMEEILTTLLSLPQTETLC